jgi:hypothetical protein
VDFDNDEGLGGMLRRELIEIACFNGVSDPEALRDILIQRIALSDDFLKSASSAVRHKPAVRRSRP